MEKLKKDGKTDSYLMHVVAKGKFRKEPEM
jgi:hypothetical protein